MGRTKQTILALMLSTLLLLSGCGFFESDEGITAAVRAGDPNMCAQLEEDDSGDRIDRCYSEVGQKIKDPAVCKKIDSSNRADDCYSGVAVGTRNASLCKQVSDSMDLVDCVTDVAENTGNVNDCRIAPESSQDDCVFSVATGTSDFTDCDKLKDDTTKLACQTQIAVNKKDPSLCKKIQAQSTRDSCLEQLNTKNEPVDNSCETEYDCDIYKVCINNYCQTPQCTEDTAYCLGDKRQFCDGRELHVETCIYGCMNGECLTKEEANMYADKEEKETQCNEGEAECLTETTLQFCEDGKKTEGYCRFGCKRGKCQEEPGVDISGTLGDLQTKAEFAEVVAGPYMEDLQKAIDSETDPARLAGLEAYKEFLDGSAEKYGEAVATLEDLEKLKRIFIDQYDPSMDVENMDVDDILSKGLGEKISDKVSETIGRLNPWAHTPSIEEQEQAQAEEQLQVYEAMLERQGEIDFLKKSRLERIGDTVAGMAKDKLVGDISDKAKELAEEAGGTAFMTVGIVGDALETVQDEAQNMMFTGLIKAYNRRRAVLEDKYPDMSNEEIHKQTVSEVEDFPYADAKTGVVIAKYGNLLANKDCTEDDSNPLCVDRHAFWVAMDKSYEHFNDKKLFDRWLEQNKPDDE